MNELPASIQRLISLVKAESEMSPKRAAEFMEQANINADELMEYADYGHAVEDGYGRNLVFEDERFEIMVMSWVPGDFSSIHNHGYTAWGAVKVFGNALHHTFSNQGDNFRITKKEILTEGTVAKVNHELIHQMGNASNDPYITLHMYGADDFDGDITGDSMSYELEKGLVKYTTGGAFFNLPEERTNRIEEMGSIDERTFAYTSQFLLQYYERLNTEDAKQKHQALLMQLQELA